jgi:hypothetical protein
LTNERLRQAIYQAGLDPEGLADQIEVDIKTVQRWLAGRPPYPRFRARVARALAREEYELWPEVAHGPAVDQESVAEILAAWARADDPGVPDWRELLEQAIERVELLDYSLLDIVADNSIVDALRAKANAGCRARILISAPDSIWVRARAQAIGQDEEDHIGRSALWLEIETARGYLEPLTNVTDVDLRLLYADPGHRILRFDEEMLISPNLTATPTERAPLFHLRRRQTDGLFDQFAAHLEALSTSARPIEPAPEHYPDPRTRPDRYQPFTATTHQQLIELLKREDRATEDSARPLEQVRGEIRRATPGETDPID